MQLPRELVREDCRRLSTKPGTLHKLQGKVLLVTGGTGFLGTWLAEMIATLNDDHGFGVRMILLSTSANQFRSRMPHLGNRNDVTLLQADTANLVDLPPEVTHILHAAATPDNQQHASEPLRLIRSAVTGTQMVLEAATRLSGLKGFVNISSGLVYGPMAVDARPVDERIFTGLDSSLITSTYAEAKRMGEQLASVYRSQHRLPVVNVRPFAFVGPYQRLDRPWAINNFLRDALHNGPIRIHGGGQTVRSYMYGADAAWWLLTMLARGEVGSSYNLGSDEAVDLSQLAHKIAGLLPNRPKVTSGLLGEGVPRSSFVPSITLARRTLGLEISTDLDMALRRTIQWNQNIME
ncbi:NAD-dependent epimerase/dehydratase family protein [Azospirillum agricola]|uniref:NAD-dependent epimerase/dehydratase family protein n=1 Tax=Azospirillum agricola TaxID=1720247 RepID=UPI000A0F16EE|nr:NAD-dependent epimerase/dehydratase family protein [Azospirillum agricola]SMH41297.1 dTDP-glucose 4,6-dehydratase [Azospirillum lipoferum]